jgi:ABC-type multidrug transport system fused ATPase/permease subunit
MNGPEPHADDQSTPPLSAQVRQMARFGSRYIARRKAAVTAYVGLSVAQKGTIIAVPLIFQRIIDVLQGAVSGTSSNLRWLAAVWVGLLFIGMILAFYREIVRARLDGLMASEIRDDLFSSYLSQHPPFFHENGPGKLAAVLNQMSLEAQHAVRELLVEPAVQVVALTGTAWAILHAASGTTAPAIAMALIVTLPVLYFVNRLGKNLGRVSHESREQMLGIATLVDSALQSPEEVQAFGAEPALRRKHQSALGQLFATQINQAAAVARLNTIDGLPNVLIQGVLVGCALWVFAPGTQGAGGLVAMVMLTGSLVEPIQVFGSFAVTTRMAWPSVDQVERMLVRETPPPETAAGHVLARLEPLLEARDVTFRYRTDEPAVLNDVSFVAPPRAVTALVARMGQGKTTFFRLALRFYAPERGEIRVGDMANTDIPLADLRRQVVMMAQFPAFFYDTVRENLRLAKPDATDDELVQWCTFTGIWRVLQKMGSPEEHAAFPNPLDRPFAAGKMLGGGHRKLFALTRCLLREPTILLLDEPTAGMSNDEKYGLIPSMQKALEGRTTLIVDHDVRWLASVCQHAIVLDGGRVTQQGPIETLLEEPGLFKELYELGDDRGGDGPTDHAHSQLLHGAGEGMAGMGVGFGSR